jgi:hypothetical protein
MQLLGGPYLVGSSMYGVDQITITSTFHIPNQQYPEPVANLTVLQEKGKPVHPNQDEVDSSR